MTTLQAATAVTRYTPPPRWQWVVALAVYAIIAWAVLR